MSARDYERNTLRDEEEGLQRVLDEQARNVARLGDQVNEAGAQVRAWQTVSANREISRQAASEAAALTRAAIIGVQNKLQEMEREDQLRNNAPEP
ncbi:hypothetical protein CF326_g9508 [Tilletia indica]|nr:hypothetical protein CF326_g9508 [Tilletia indica]